MGWNLKPPNLTIPARMIRFFHRLHPSDPLEKDVPELQCEIF